MLIRQDLEFWREVVGYIDSVHFNSISEVKQLSTTLSILDKELVELDFGSAIEFLEEKYLTPTLQIK